MALYTFNYTGAQQTWVVPAGITKVRVKLQGAKGGNSGVDVGGGRGHIVEGDLTVTPGETLYLYVGGQGTAGTNVASAPATAGGWNGGGNGGPGNSGAGAAGGGASDIRRGGTAASNRIAVAGGGGGAGGGNHSSTTITGGYGGQGNHPTGSAGATGLPAGGGGGAGGGSASGGTGIGGNGVNSTGWGSGGGGGGWNGGSAGGFGNISNGSGGGGGGSSYSGGLSGTLNYAVAASGDTNGIIEIDTLNDAPSAPTNLSPGTTNSTAPEIITTLTPTVAWTFNDTQSDTQSAFQVLVYDSGGVLKHDSGKVLSVNKTYVVPPGAGLVYKTKYYWRVRTYDSQDAVSPYSVDEWIMPNQAPTGTVTAPAATSGVGTVYNDTLTPGITWSYSDPNGDPQASVQILVKDGSTTVFDSGEIVTTGTSYTIPSAAGLIYDKTYNVVIRAKDNQGTWGAYSAAKYFHLNRTPGAPTGLSPGSTNAASPVILNNNLQPTLTWTFVDSDATDTQSAFWLQIYDGTSNSLVHEIQDFNPANYYAIPSGVLLAGKKYYWKVKARDSHLLYGGYSANFYFYTNENPDTPINPSPAGGSSAAPAQVMNTLTPRLSWTFKDEAGEAQISYQLRLYNEAGTILIDTGQVSSANGYYDIQAINKLAYNNKYQWEVRTMDPYGQWSSYTDRLWIQPKMAAPTGLTATADNFGAKIILDWTDSGGEELQGYNVYRATTSGGTFTKINGALLTASIFNDTQVSTGQTYFYKVEAVASGETSPFSNEASATAIFANWYIGNFKFLGPTSMKGKRPRAQSKRTVLGKSKKVIQDRGFLGQEMQLEIYLATDEYSSGKSKFDQLMAELEVTAEISIRDPFGQVWKVAPGDVDWDVIPGTGSLAYKVSFPLEEVN